MEVWKPLTKQKIVHYEVSNYGRFRNNLTQEIVPTDMQGSYLRVWLPISSSRATNVLLVHKVVAEHFLTKPTVPCTLEFIDGNKENYKADNLMWRPRFKNIC